MAVKPTGGPTGATTPGTIIRPLYGMVIRDQVEQYRNMLGVTLSDLKKGIKAGKADKHAVRGDGILQGSELTKAKKAAVAVDKAIKALKPVFGEGFGPMSQTQGQTGLSRPPGQFVQMYGIVLADDLRKYRTEISTNISTIQNAIDSGALAGPAKSEATKAIRSLKSALTQLKGAEGW